MQYFLLCSQDEIQTDKPDGKENGSKSNSKLGCFYTFWNLPFKLKKFMVTGIGMTTLDVFTDLVQAINHFL